MKFTLLFLLLFQPLLIYSLDFNANDFKKIELEIRKKFSEHKEFVNSPMKNSELLCKCNHDGCSSEITDIAGSKYEGICRAHSGGQCRRMVHLGKDKKIREIVLSCVHSEQLLPKERPFFCQNVNTAHLVQFVQCCRDGSFCNDKKFPIEENLESNISTTIEDNSNSSLFFKFIIILFIVSIIFSGIGLCIGIYFGTKCIDGIKKYFDNFINFLRIFYNRHFNFFQQNRTNNFQMEHQVYHIEEDHERNLNDEDYDENNEEYDDFIPNESINKKKKLKKLIGDLERVGPSSTSNLNNPLSTGSGAGMPKLVKRTIAWQITLKDCIGRGRFGEVYMGVWRAEKVAIKIFLSRDEPSWQRETDIYRHNMLRHSNLLRWIGSDTRDAGSSTQLWLVTEYLPNGSLFDYLEQNKISIELNIQFIRSIAHGLAYLHSELPGINNQCHKPGIAHRDIKSRNILIKNDWTCCIADLGMAIRFSNGVIDIPLQDGGGTVRYLAPEFLSNTYIRDNFTSYLQMDVYAFSLIMWEACRRTEDLNTNILALPYEIPYQEYVPREPLLEHMLQCVVIQNKRPTIDSNWKNNEILNELIRIMSESWSLYPKSRLTALNIRVSLDRICEEKNLKIIT